MNHSHLPNFHMFDFHLLFLLRLRSIDVLSVFFFDFEADPGGLNGFWGTLPSVWSPNWSLFVGPSGLGT